MAQKYTQKEMEFLNYFRSVDKHALEKILRTKFACYHVCMKDPQRLLFNCPHKDSKSRFGWMTHTHFKDSYRKQGPAVPGSRV